MGKKKAYSTIKNILSIIAVSLIGCVGIVFSVLYIETFSSEFILVYKDILVSVSVGLITIFTMLTLFFTYSNHKFLNKLFLVIITLISLCVVSLYILNVSGFLDKVDSIEDFREYVASFGSYATVIFIIIQLLQVVVLPIPGFITVGAGVLLFGALKGAIFSCIGIITGSLIAFFIGRIFGYKVAKWLVGKDCLDKGLKTIKGKDKIILTFMFLFPFFPDDILCFVAGITTISPLFFVIMIFITRIISIFASSYSMNNSIIPYDTWWGILLWILFFTATILFTIFIYKYGEKIERIFKKIISDKKRVK